MRDKMVNEVREMHTLTENGGKRVLFLDAEPEPEPSKCDGHVETTKDADGRTHVRFGDGIDQASWSNIQNTIIGRSYVNFESPEKLQPRSLVFESKCSLELDAKDETSEPGHHLAQVWAADQWGDGYGDWPNRKAGQDSDSEPDAVDADGTEVFETGENAVQNPVQTKSEAKNQAGQAPVSMQAIFDKESNLSTSEIFAALVQAEEASLVASSSPQKNSPHAGPRYGQRHRVTLAVWPLDDPVLKELLAFWESSSCHYGGDHEQRLKYVAKYLAFEEKSPEAGTLNIRVQMTDTVKVTRYLDFLSSKNQSPATILKSLDMIRHTLNWVVMRRLRPKGKKYLKKYTGCCQAREVLAELRSAWQTVSNRDNRRTTTIGSILRANKWPTDEEVQTLVDKCLPNYKLLRARRKQGGDISDGEMQWILSLLANACTIHVTFGRPSLFQRLTVAHGERAVESQVVGTSEFKTWSKWFIHSMYFAGGARSLLKDWLEIWRPVVAPEAPKPSDPLFVDQDNKGIENWSRVLSLLWEKTFKRSMTATILRYWKATKVALRAETDEERKLVFEADWSVCRVFLVFVSVLSRSPLCTTFC